MSKMMDYIAGKADGPEALLEAQVEHMGGHLETALKENQELRAALDAANSRIALLEKENFALAADQCHDGYAGEHGDHCCREVDELKARVTRFGLALAEIRDSHIGDRPLALGGEPKELWPQRCFDHLRKIASAALSTGAGEEKR